MSKFYIKANMVVDHPDEIAKKQNINNYAIDVVNGKKDTGFKGEKFSSKEIILGMNKSSHSTRKPKNQRTKIRTMARLQIKRQSGS